MNVPLLLPASASATPPRGVRPTNLRCTLETRGSDTRSPSVISRPTSLPTRESSGHDAPTKFESGEYTTTKAPLIAPEDAGSPSLLEPRVSPMAATSRYDAGCTMGRRNEAARFAAVAFLKEAQSIRGVQIIDLRRPTASYSLLHERLRVALRIGQRERATRKGVAEALRLAAARIVRRFVVAVLRHRRPRRPGRGERVPLHGKRARLVDSLAEIEEAREGARVVEDVRVRRSEEHTSELQSR